MKIKKWLGVAAIATMAQALHLKACGNSEKKADNESSCQNCSTVNRR